ncbi:amidase [Spongisporangium articulatum]|uniref:Amidase n=1 Tax=Spongisporangium articulatum TaxID=3362603 RepID=A0ABW8AGP1_9ACTN
MFSAEQYAATDGLGLAQAVAEGEVTATELLGWARARLAAVNPQLNVVVTTLDEYADKRATEPLSGPFAGVPFLLKDLMQDLAGYPTSGGCRALSRTPATRNETVVQRWLDAGVVVFGKTNTPEFGSKGVTEPELFGPARNPWDPSRTPGGSSGGAAAAVASGVVPVAAASDGGGSIRIPAACCGVFGLKPGRGVVPAGPKDSEHMFGIATDGVISRSVRDSAAMLDVLAGPDPAPPYVVAPPAQPYLAEVGREPGRLRVGVQTASALNPDLHPEAAAAARDAAEVLSGLGHEVEEASVDYDDAELARDFLLPWFVQVAVQQREALRDYRGRGGTELDTRVMAAIGRATSAPSLTETLNRWHGYVAALSAFHDRYDLLLTPALSQPPVKIGALATSPLERFGARLALGLRLGWILPHIGIVQTVIDKNLGWVPYTQLANLTGRPAMSVPLHWTGDGLPLGVQLVAGPGREGMLLRLAAQLEGARPWADRRPGV